MSFKSNVAAVTGAGGGIGQAVALYLAEKGATVVLIDRDTDAIVETSELIRRIEGVSVSFAVDVSDVAAVQRIFSEVRESVGCVKHLVTSAGILTPNVMAQDADLGDFDQAMAVNVKGTFAAAQAAFPHMVELGGGSIVTITSQAALISLPAQAIYASTKGAVAALTRSLAIDWAQFQIRVNSVAPTFTATPMAREMLADPQVSKTVLSRIPLGRVAEPRDIATSIAFLLSEDARMVTGHVLPVDGGWTAGDANFKL